MFIVCYFVFGWHKEKSRTIEGIENVHFNKNQILTLIGFAAYVFMTLVLKMDTLIAPTLIAFILMLIGAVDTKKAISSIPWNVLIMIGGMSMLTGVVKTLGGVALLANAISAVNVPALCAPLMLLVAGLMSFFSSGNGVVLPTLIPIIPSLNASAGALTAAVGMGASCTGISPLSVIGGHMMSCYDAIYKPTEEERTKTFNQLMIAAVVCMVVNALFALVGLYNISIL